jgi:NADP-dependent 3-hydroxy acid dehydrogenase YdfG
MSLVEKEHHDVYPAIDPRAKLKGVAEGKVAVLTGAGKGIGEVYSVSATMT